MDDRIWLSPPNMGGEEIKYIHKAFESNWLAPLGPNVDEFEKILARFCEVEHAAALVSGTAAIHLALILLGVGRDDEVIVSSFTFSATVNPIVYQGAIPILVDSEPVTWNMSPELLEAAIKDRISKGKKPKAIILVHLYGMPARIDEILKIAERYEIDIIEDAAEGLGSRFNSKPLGSFGKLAILSFNGNKIITTTGGGALLSNEENFISRARFLASQARDQAPHYQHSQIGYNYRMSNVLAGIGCGQMDVLAHHIKQKRKVNVFYKERLNQIDSIQFLEEPNESYYSNFWLTTILIDPSDSGVTRDHVQEKLMEDNIESRPVWKPMHLQPVFEDYPSYTNGTSERLFNLGICLPSGSNLSRLQQNRVIDIIKSILQ